MKIIQALLVFLSVYLLLMPMSQAQLERVEAFYKQLEKENKQKPATIGFIQENSGLVEDYSKLSQIILVRHGEPALNKKGWRNRKGAIQYGKDYDSVGIYPPAFIPVTLQEQELDIIHTSSLNRSISTAKLVFEREDLLKPDTLFREFERRIATFPNIKLPLKWWIMGSRVLWFMGTNHRGIESFAEAKRRAKKGSNFLAKDARRNGKSLLVAHGFLNLFLVKYLKKQGWKEVYNGGSGYLAQDLLVKYE